MFEGDFEETCAEKIWCQWGNEQPLQACTDRERGPPSPPTESFNKTSRDFKLQQANILKCSAGDFVLTCVLRSLAQRKRNEIIPSP